MSSVVADLVAAADKARVILREEREIIYSSHKEPDGSVKDVGIARSLQRFDRTLKALDDSIAKSSTAASVADLQRALLALLHPDGLFKETDASHVILAQYGRFPSLFHKGKTVEDLRRRIFLLDPNAALYRQWGQG